MFVNYGVHASLHPNFHHQKVLIFILLTPHHNIRKTFDLVYWETLFSYKNIKAQVTVFNESILNISWNLVSNKYITCDDKDSVWANETIKSKINNTHRMDKKKVIL